MSKRLNVLASVVALSAASSATFGVAVTVDKTGILNPNPNNLTITEVGNTSLATFRTLVSAANLTNTGGVLDFQQRNQGGTFVNSTSANNGVDLGNGITNSIYVAPSGGPVGDGLVGTPILSFFRAENATAGANAFDSNLDQGTNVISGGPLTRYPGPVSPTNPSGDGTSSASAVNPAYGAAIPGNINGGYFGIAGAATPATLVFDRPLSAFGITALPRGSNRETTITLTLTDGSTVSIGPNAVTTAAVFFGFQAPVGLGITQAALINPALPSPNPNAVVAGQNRYDDLAFVLIPEPSALGLLGVGALGLLRRRRHA